MLYIGSRCFIVPSQAQDILNILVYSRYITEDLQYANSTSFKLLLGSCNTQHTPAPSTYICMLAEERSWLASFD